MANLTVKALEDKHGREIEALKARIEGLEAALTKVQAGKPAPAKRLSTDAKGRSPKAYAADAQRVLSNHTDAKCWVEAMPDEKFVISGFGKDTPALSVSEVNNAVRALRSGKTMEDYLASLKPEQAKKPAAQAEDTPPWEEEPAVEMEYTG